MALKYRCVVSAARLSPMGVAADFSSFACEDWPAAHGPGPPPIKTASDAAVTSARILFVAGLFLTVSPWSMADVNRPDLRHLAPRPNRTILIVSIRMIASSSGDWFLM